MASYRYKIEKGGHTIQYNDTTYCRTGVWTRPDGTTELVEGTWAFAPGYSWFATESRRWVVVGGHWQV